MLEVAFIGPAKLSLTDRNRLRRACRRHGYRLTESWIIPVQSSLSLGDSMIKILKDYGSSLLWTPQKVSEDWVKSFSGS